MHASVEQLLSIRDREPVDALVSQHVSECAECCVELESYRRIEKSLKSLPELEPPNIFSQVLERGHGTQLKPAREWLKLAVAATLVASLSIAFIQFVHNDDSFQTPIASNEVAPISPVAPTTTAPEVDTLRAQSQQLEAALRQVSFGGQRDVMDVRTADTIVALEDRLAMVDYTLTNGRLTPQQRQRLWRERVRLLDSLVRVRYAQYTSATY